MDKLEFINFLIKNNYQYYESKFEINIEELRDEIGNVDRCYTFDKDKRKFYISRDKQINPESAPNDLYELDELELTILKYFLNLLEKEGIKDE